MVTLQNYSRGVSNYDTELKIIKLRYRIEKYKTAILD